RRHLRGRRDGQTRCLAGRPPRPPHEGVVMCYTGNPTCEYRGDSPHECEWPAEPTTDRRGRVALNQTPEPKTRRIIMRSMITRGARYVAAETEHAKTANDWRVIASTARRIADDCEILAHAQETLDAQIAAQGGAA